jgi:hypothetical protein
MSPADFLKKMYQLAAEHGFVMEAIDLAKDAAPYFNAKLQPIPDFFNSGEGAPPREYALIPAKARSVEEWVEQVTGDRGKPN